MKKLVSIALSLVLIAALAIPAPMQVKAAGYSGSGTKSDPYLVTNAEQLQGMRDNLSAHYRLADTIDLSGVDFKPIGRLDAPFTGTFVCQLNADKTPKYVIKNLAQTIAESAYAAENKNKWEGGLFGATSGASISGIYILNANVTNNNIGGNTGGVAWGNYKPGMDEMATGILIGTAKNTSVSNCGTSGNVGGKPNNTGGLIGNAQGCKIKNCYSTADAVTTGFWNVGGFIGMVKDCNISSCYSTGNAQGGQSSAAGFIGAVAGATTISDCYSTGDAGCPKEDATNFVTCRESTGSRLINCYAAGTVTSAPNVSKWGNYNVSNCYTVSGVTCGIPEMTEADMGTIKGKLSGGNWDASGSAPRLVNIGVADAGAYKPGMGSTGAAGGNEQPGQNGTKNPDGTTTDPTGGNDAAQEPTFSATVSEVTALIEALPDPEDASAITLDLKEDVMKAYSAYEALSTGEKDDFNSELVSKLYNVRYKVSLLLVNDMITRVKALPDVKDLTKDNVKEILEIWDDYNFIDDEIKAEIDEEYVNKIEAAHAFAEEQQNTVSMDVRVGDTLTKWQIVVLVICGLLVLSGVIFNIVSFVGLSRRIKGKDSGKKETKK